MSKAEVIADLRAARARLLEAIAGLTAEQMRQVGACGIWSVKDVLAHLVAWEAELVTTLSRLEQHTQRAPWIAEVEDLDEWNAEQYHLNAPRALDDVLTDFHGVHKHLILAIEALDDRVLTNNRQFPWMEGEPISYLVAENATWHEEEHADDIAAWRETSGA